MMHGYRARQNDEARVHDRTRASETARGAARPAGRRADKAEREASAGP